MKINQEESKKIILNYFTKRASDSIPLLENDPGRKNWVQWGKRDLMPNRLFELYTSSGFHNAIIDARVNMIVGNGLIQTDEISKRTEDFINSPNDDETCASLVKKLAFDYEIYGIAYIEVIYSRDRSQISQINHIDANKIRWGHKFNNRLTHVYFSNDFKSTNRNKPTPIPIFNPKLKKDQPRQILPIVRYTPSVDYYTLPSYYATIKWISIDYEIGNFHEHNIMNGFTPTIYFGFPHGTPTEDEREEIVRSLESNYGGTDNAGGVITAFYEPGPDNKVDVQVLDISDADKQFEWLSTETTKHILTGHKVTNENLVGISTPGKLGTSNELLQAHELYFNDVIKHEQSDILDKLNKIFLFNGMTEVTFENIKPLSQELSEGALLQILTTDELRDIVGYESLEANEIEEPIAEVENKELEAGDIIKFNGKSLKLSQDIIDEASGIKDSADVKDVYVWTLGPGGLSKKNCPSCLSFAGQIRQLRRWQRIAIPGTPATAFGGTFPHGAYGTFCENHCTCKLIRIEQ